MILEYNIIISPLKTKVMALHGSYPVWRTNHVNLDPYVGWFKEQLNHFKNEVRPETKINFYKVMALPMLL